MAWNEATGEEETIVVEAPGDGEYLDTIHVESENALLCEIRFYVE
jgi:hypothetical protein